MKRKHWMILLVLLSFGVIVLCFNQAERVVQYILNSSQDKVTIVIDAGHGGFDPGKIGFHNIQEKDINLSIAYKLKKFLEQENINVILTRKDGNGLYKKNDTDKKRADMNNRIKIINSSGALFALSIHQNSFSQESSWGAQVFYYESSAKGQNLAELLQATIKDSIGDGNHRQARPNGTYYLLRHSNCPLVIVECGFLTNRKEAELLCDDAYQDRMAWAIHLGVMEYINQNSYLKQ